MDAKQIGERLTVLRGDRKQKEVAAQLGISVSALSMYENGERIPRDNIKIRIAAFYNQPIYDIFFT
jgi:transcriptional regulator with XRE-family HTH domain